MSELFEGYFNKVWTFWGDISVRYEIPPQKVQTLLNYLWNCSYLIESRFRCYWPWFKCYLTWFRCYWPWFRCYLTWFRCYWPWFRCYRPWFRCYWPWFRHYLTWFRYYWTPHIAQKITQNFVIFYCPWFRPYWLQLRPFWHIL